MSVAGLITWILAACFGVYLLFIWLFEYDKDLRYAARTRLPPPVLAGHAAVAVGGLIIWIAYLIFASDRLAWYSVIALVLAAALGSTMTIRWISVYRAERASRRAAMTGPIAPVEGGSYPSWPAADWPPERSFPLPAVIIHGIFAVTTLTLVLLTALGVGGS
jgi:manganese efflux pump family protein